jgi:hypothetical protein
MDGYTGAGSAPHGLAAGRQTGPVEMVAGGSGPPDSGPLRMLP